MKELGDVKVAAEIYSPYLAAKQEWDARIGSARVQARNWRIAAFLALLIAVIAVMGVIQTAGKVKVVPYIVEVDSAGRVNGMGLVSLKPVEVEDKVVKFLLARWIEDIRSLSLDPVVLRANWERAYHFLTQRGTRLLNEYARQNDPFAEVGQKTITVEIISMLERSLRTFEMEWREVIYDKHGTVMDTQVFGGVFQSVLQSTDDIQILADNPLGVFIDHFSWARKRVS